MAATSEPLALIWCADGNQAHSRAAIAAGWLYGVRLPAKGMVKGVPLAFADQDWKRPNRSKYMALLREHRPAMATVIDWEEPGQLPEVLSWAEEAAESVAEAVLVVAKVPGGVPDIPEAIGGKEVRIAYSVPTSYGGSTIGLWEMKGRPVHLLGGSPQKQYEIYRYLSAEVKSVDGNMCKKMATSRCCYWSREKTDKGHWNVLSGFEGDAVTECVSMSCRNIASFWRDVAGVTIRGGQ